MDDLNLKATEDFKNPEPRAHQASLPRSGTVSFSSNLRHFIRSSFYIVFLPILLVFALASFFIFQVYGPTEQGHATRTIGESLSLVLAFVLAFVVRRQLLRRLQEGLRLGQRAQELLRQLETITDAAPIAIVHVDREERYVFSNRYYAEHFGRQAPAGKKIRELLGDDAYARLRPHIQTALSGKIVTFETPIARPDGTVLHTKVTYAPSFADSGEVTGFVAISEDITAKKLAASELQNVQTKNAFLLQAVSAFSKALTPSELLLTTIDLCEQAFGADSGILVVPNETKTHLAFVPKISSKYTASANSAEKGVPINSEIAVARIFRTGQPDFSGSRFDREPLYPDTPGVDPERYVEAFAALPLSFEGRKTGLIGVGFRNPRTWSEAERRALIAMSDLASQALERSQLFEQTQHERDRYRAFFDLSASGAAEIDPITNRFVRVNQRFSEITGFSGMS